MRTRIALAAALAALLAGCGSTPAPVSRSGTADVAFAGSLQLVMSKYLGPAFTRADGYTYQGRGGGSLGLAQEVLSGEIAPNVFISVGPGPLALLEPRYTRWALRIASSPLVVAYYPGGPYAGQLRRIRDHQLPLRDLFTLMARPGFRLGRTDPATDPQGQAFAMMVGLAVKLYGLPAAVAAQDLGGADPGAELYPETALEAQLQAGQLDAASAFESEAVQLHLPFISLPAAINFGDPQDLAQYRAASLRISPTEVVHGSLLDIEETVLGTSSRAAALAFVEFLAGPKGRAILSRQGYETPPLQLLGDPSAAPAKIRRMAQ
jgi:molybdate/tungstate transport system substrate-binding protein